MINTIKNFKWFFGVSFLCVLLGVFTFITFINQNFIFLNENNLQYLLILDVALLVIFLILLIRETSKIFYEYKSKTAGSRTSLNYVLQFSLFAFIPSLIVAVFSLILFNVGLQKYFDQKITSAVNNSYEVAKNYIEETKRSVETDVLLIGFDLSRYSGGRRFRAAQALPNQNIKVCWDTICNRLYNKLCKKCPKTDIQKVQPMYVKFAPM